MITFRRELADLVLSGFKTETRRRLSDKPASPWYREGCKHEPGTRHAVCVKGEKALGYIVIDDVALVRLGDITPDGARAEGFDSVEAFRATWEELHGGWNPRERVYRVRFHVETAAERMAAA